jgi:hypothetical protein
MFPYGPLSVVSLLPFRASLCPFLPLRSFGYCPAEPPRGLDEVYNGYRLFVIADESCVLPVLLAFTGY